MKNWLCSMIGHSYGDLPIMEKVKGKWVEKSMPFPYCRRCFYDPLSDEVPAPK